MHTVPILSLLLLFSLSPSLANYTCCRYPGWPTTVLNFEYPDQHPDHTIYHGLTWKGWVGYRFYPGYSTGWAPIPSNYTTLTAEAGQKPVDLYIGPGTRRFQDVHSLWFNYYEIYLKDQPAQTAVITFLGYNGGLFMGKTEVSVSAWDDHVWVHACFTWKMAIDHIVIRLPDCGKRGCAGKSFEVDDVWVKPGGKE